MTHYVIKHHISSNIYDTYSIIKYHIPSSSYDTYYIIKLHIPSGTYDTNSNQASTLVKASIDFVRKRCYKNVNVGICKTCCKYI